MADIKEKDRELEAAAAAAANIILLFFVNGSTSSNKGYFLLHVFYHFRLAPVNFLIVKFARLL